MPAFSTDTWFEVFRNYRDACNLTGRYNLPSANCVTFFGRREKTTTVLICGSKFVRFGKFLLRNEGLAAYGLWLFGPVHLALRTISNSSGRGFRQVEHTAREQPVAESRWVIRA